MIGWLVLGAVAHDANKKRRKAERAQLRRESPMPNAVWVVYGVFLVASILSPPAIPGMLAIGAGIYFYADRRRKEHEAWKAEQAAKAAAKEAARVQIGRFNVQLPTRFVTTHRDRLSA